MEVGSTGNRETDKLRKYLCISTASENIGKVLLIFSCDQQGKSINVNMENSAKKKKNTSVLAFFEFFLQLLHFLGIAQQLGDYAYWLSSQEFWTLMPVWSI